MFIVLYFHGNINVFFHFSSFPLLKLAYLSSNPLLTISVEKKAFDVFTSLFYYYWSWASLQCKSIYFAFAVTGAFRRVQQPDSTVLYSNTPIRQPNCLSLVFRGSRFENIICKNGFVQHRINDRSSATSHTNLPLTGTGVNGQYYSFLYISLAFFDFESYGHYFAALGKAEDWK